MKVKDLQEKLSGLDPDLDVVVYTEDERVQVEGRRVSLFDIQAIGGGEAHIEELDGELPWPKFERGPKSSRYVFVELKPAGRTMQG